MAAGKQPQSAPIFSCFSRYRLIDKGKFLVYALYMDKKMIVNAKGDQYILKTRLTLRREGRYDGHGFGRGIAQLLDGIDRFGSLNMAAKEMEMAYSKAWRIIKQAEEEFSLQLISRDGAHGSTITEEGRAFYNHYLEMVAAAERAAQDVFEKYYGQKPTPAE